MTASNLPHGGVLTERLVSPAEASVWRKQKTLKGLWPLTTRQLCDLELIVNGGFSPLKGYMVRADYDGVVSRMRSKTERYGRYRSLSMLPMHSLKNSRSAIASD